MILQIFLHIFGYLIKIIINLLTSNVPSADLGSTLITIVTSMLAFTQQALNFCYLIFGDTMFIVLPTAITLLIAKYVIIPIIVILRSFFINSNE